jgi:hypothetical protein
MTATARRTIRQAEQVCAVARWMRLIPYRPGALNARRVRPVGRKWHGQSRAILAGPGGVGAPQPRSVRAAAPCQVLALTCPVLTGWKRRAIDAGPIKRRSRDSV